MLCWYLFQDFLILWPILWKRMAATILLPFMLTMMIGSILTVLWLLVIPILFEYLSNLLWRHLEMIFMIPDTFLVYWWSDQWELGNSNLLLSQSISGRRWVDSKIPNPPPYNRLCHPITACATTLNFPSPIDPFYCLECLLNCLECL